MSSHVLGLVRFQFSVFCLPIRGYPHTITWRSPNSHHATILIIDPVMTRSPSGYNGCSCSHLLACLRVSACGNTKRELSNCSVIAGCLFWDANTPWRALKWLVIWSIWLLSNLFWIDPFLCNRLLIASSAESEYCWDTAAELLDVIPEFLADSGVDQKVDGVVGVFQMKAHSSWECVPCVVLCTGVPGIIRGIGLYKINRNIPRLHFCLRNLGWGWRFCNSFFYRG